MRNYAKEIEMLRNNPRLKMIESESRIIHASPFRATIRIDETFGSDVDFDRDLQEDSPKDSPLQSYRQGRKSPIKEDSVMMRGYSNEFLRSFQAD